MTSSSQILIYSPFRSSSHPIWNCIYIIICWSCKLEGKPGIKSSYPSLHQIKKFEKKKKYGDMPNINTKNLRLFKNCTVLNTEEFFLSFSLRNSGLRIKCLFVSKISSCAPWNKSISVYATVCIFYLEDGRSRFLWNTGCPLTELHNVTPNKLPFRQPQESPNNLSN